MPVRLHHIVIDAHDLPGLARFWTQALGWKVLSEREKEIVIGTDENAPAGMCFMPVTDPKTVKNRVHQKRLFASGVRDCGLPVRVASVITWPRSLIVPEPCCHHVDYLHDEHVHRPHDGHYDECASSGHQPAEEHIHVHGDGCGHAPVLHGDHLDYVHDGHRHAAHEGHYDEH